MDQNDFLKKAKEEFEAGSEGDCILVFKNGDEVYERKCASYFLRKVEYFAAFQNFEHTKEFKIDVSQFYEASKEFGVCKLPMGEFVNAVFGVLFDNDDD